MRCYAIDERFPPEEVLSLARARFDEPKPDLLHVYFDEGFPILQLLHAVKRAELRRSRGIMFARTLHGSVR
ncbi:MAG: hypothetical protein E5W34_02780 [Mesorhizobium sp.]|nr:MAG: hypothetical protein E5W34_02780 [Mesorhizobium sp.]